MRVYYGTQVEVCRYSERVCRVELQVVVVRGGEKCSRIEGEEAKLRDTKLVRQGRLGNDMRRLEDVTGCRGIGVQVPEFDGRI